MRLPLTAATLGCALVLTLAGCASSTDDGAAGTPSPAGTTPAPAASTAAASWPVTLDNCEHPVTVTAPPQRIVTIKSSTLELALSLGLGDRIIGSAFSDGPVPDDLADAASTIPVISDKVPGQEALLALRPDFVFAGWESNLSADGAGDRATLEGMGIGTYVAPAACKEPGAMPDPMTFPKLFDQITEAGDVFGVPQAAADLVSKQQAALAAITPSSDHLSALWYSSGTDTPYVGAGIGVPEMLMDAAGLNNVYADVHDTWTSAGWEDIVAKNPDVIVLVDATWNTADSKKAALAANPATAALDAVRNQRYVVVPFPATEAGVRNVDAVQEIVDQLAALG